MALSVSPNNRSQINRSTTSANQGGPRLSHVAAVFGVIIIALQLGYQPFKGDDAVSSLWNEGVATLWEPSADEDVESARLKTQVDQMTQAMSKLQNELESNKAQQSSEKDRELKTLKSELKTLKEQVVKDEKETKKQDDKTQSELQKQLGALKTELENVKEQNTASDRVLEDTSAQAETAKEIEALKQQLKELKEQKETPSAAKEETTLTESTEQTEQKETQTTTQEEKTKESTKRTKKKKISAEKEATEVSNTVDLTPDPTNPYAKPPVASEFTWQEGVVVATKIHGMHQVFILKQCLCLFHYAYNKKMKYDIVVYTTEPITDEATKELQQIVKPAKLFVVVDNPGLQELVAELPPNRREKFLKKCQLEDPAKLKNVSWFDDCKENGRSSRLAYNWQAEFRAERVWTHNSLKPYRYMLWIDADAFCTEEWTRDPVAFFIEHNLAIFFANFGAGKSPGGYPEFKSRFMTAFNQTLSDVEVVEGHLTSKNGTGPVKQIHGFMHMTDLDFFRSEQVQLWTRTLIGEEFLSRRFDDQLAVTAPTAILAPERSWHMRDNGVKLNVFHNGWLDGTEKSKKYNFLSYWNDGGGKEKMPAATKKCEITANGR